MIPRELQKRILSSFLLIPMVIFFIYQSLFIFIFFLIIIYLFTLYEWLNISKKILIKLLGILYISLSFYLANLLRDNYGPYVFFFVLIVSISTDIGGYFFGKIIKGPKLIKISPNKTYSGMIGSFALSLVLGYLYLNYYKSLEPINQIYSSQLIKFNNIFLILIIIFIISGISQIGDLIISYFKRLANVKNSGTLIPGHGGLLDRIDGIIFAIPISYLLFYYLI